MTYNNARISIVKIYHLLFHSHRHHSEAFVVATPYSLVYGIEFVLPVEVEIISLRIMSESGLEEIECVQAQYYQLNMIKGKRRLVRTLAKKVHPHYFLEGDFVLKKILPIQKDHGGNGLETTKVHLWLKNALSRGLLTLTTMDGNNLPR
ncbi:hypothetical protein Lal_00046061, partial [Lupinus albus]